jgi:molybdopterin synthase sulfur carrier subunit
MASIKIPTPLRAYTANQATVEVSGDTVGNALDDLVTQYPDLKAHLFNDGNFATSSTSSLVKMIFASLDGVDTSIETDTKLRIFPSIAGGAK